jgi:hypothetical protein
MHQNFIIGLVILAAVSCAIYFSFNPISFPSSSNKINDNKQKFKDISKLLFMMTDSNGNISTYDSSVNVFNSKGVYSTGDITIIGDLKSNNINVTSDIKAGGTVTSGTNIANNIICTDITSTTNTSTKTISDNYKGSVKIEGGSGGNTAGHIQFFKQNGVRKGYIGWGAGANNNYIELAAEDADGYRISTGKQFCIGDTCITETDLSRLKKFLNNLSYIKDNFDYLSQRGGTNDGTTNSNNGKWAACLGPFFAEIARVLNY